MNRVAKSEVGEKMIVCTGRWWDGEIRDRLASDVKLIRKWLVVRKEWSEYCRLREEIISRLFTTIPNSHVYFLKRSDESKTYRIGPNFRGA